MPAATNEGPAGRCVPAGFSRGGEKEPPMTETDERRDLGRTPSFSYVKLVTTDARGNEKTLPLILRDRSGTGVGAMYIGKEVLNPAAEYTLRDSEGGEKQVRLVWTKRVADFVQMLGLAIADG